MFRKIHDRKGQNTAEYAILISLVVAGIIAMQTYAQRALHSRIKAASTLMTDQGGTETVAGSGWRLDTQEQYEPYYMQTDYAIDKEGVESQRLTEGADRAITTEADTTRTREAGGFTRSNYNSDTFQEAW